MSTVRIYLTWMNHPVLRFFFRVSACRQSFLGGSPVGKINDGFQTIVIFL
jgi:hypothetical protein